MLGSTGPETAPTNVKQVIANKIIALAKGPDALCEKVLKDIRTEPA